MEPDARAGLLGCISRMIDTRYGGRIVKRHLTQLSTAQLALEL